MQKRRKSLRKLSVIFFFFVLQKILIHYPNQDKLHKFYLNRSILQYTQQEAVFDEIGELLLGIALVEMKHYAGVRDAIVALGGKLPQPYSSKNVKIGTSLVEALTLAIESEIATIEFYKSIEIKFSQDTDSVIIMKQLLKKLIADESLHLKLLNRYLKDSVNDEQKYNSIVGEWLSKIKLYIE